MPLHIQNGLAKSNIPFSNAKVANKLKHFMLEEYKLLAESKNEKLLTDGEF